MTPAEARDWVVAQGRALGFDLCGVAPAHDFDELARLPEWLARGYAGEMRYLHDPRRRSPQATLPGARSIIVCALNYNTPFPYSTSASSASGVYPDAVGAVKSSARGWISRYAWGDDYHHVLGAKLDALLAAMHAQFAATPFDARAYVDTGPVHERIAAHHAGLGWLGKNTCLIHERLGSWLFLGVILTTLDLAPSLSNSEVNDLPSLKSEQSFPSPPFADESVESADSLLPPDLCGQCTQCLDACPTGALVEPYVLDARRCISYLTIELRGPIPDEFHSALGWHLFGCDICQDVCPFNRRAPTTPDPRFFPRAFEVGTQNSEVRTPISAVSSLDGPKTRTPSAPSAPALSEVEGPSAVKSFSFFAPPLESFTSLSESAFRSLFKNSAIKRTKHAGLARNAALALKNSGAPAVPDE
jgi:epoxyqueuosine reductase